MTDDKILMHYTDDIILLQRGDFKKALENMLLAQQQGMGLIKYVIYSLSNM